MQLQDDFAHKQQQKNNTNCVILQQLKQITTPTTPTTTLKFIHYMQNKTHYVIMYLKHDSLLRPFLLSK